MHAQIILIQVVIKERIKQYEKRDVAILKEQRQLRICDPLRWKDKNDLSYDGKKDYAK